MNKEEQLLQRFEHILFLYEDVSIFLSKNDHMENEQKVVRFCLKELQEFKEILYEGETDL